MRHSIAPGRSRHGDLRRCVSEVSKPELVRFVVFFGSLFAITVASNATVIHGAEASAELSEGYLACWALVSAASILLVSILGGLLVFRSTTKWPVILTWPLLGGAIVGFGSYLTYGFMGQFEPGSASCETGNQSCNLFFGFGAVFLAVAATIPMGVSFIGTYIIKRLVARIYRSLPK